VVIIVIPGARSEDFMTPSPSDPVSRQDQPSSGDTVDSIHGSPRATVEPEPGTKTKKKGRHESKGKDKALKSAALSATQDAM
jgi:hypothetical protein